MVVMKNNKPSSINVTDGAQRKHSILSGIIFSVTFLAVIIGGIIYRPSVYSASDPVSGDETVQAVVGGAAPSVPPAITNISSGTVFSDTNPVTLSGTCPVDTLLKIYKNEVLAGAVYCSNGRFSIEVDLFLGANTIIIRAFSSTNEMGPESTPLILQKNLPGIANFETSRQLYITSDVYYKGVNIGEPLSWPISVVGGQPPYALNISWGDGTTDLVSRGTEGMFDIKHTYDKPGEGYKGSYDVTISASDNDGNKTFIHLVSIVGGVSSSGKQDKSTTSKQSTITKAALKYGGISLLIVVAFWLGGRHELHILKKKGTA